MLIKRQTRTVLRAVSVALVTALAGCGSDSEAGAFFPGTTPSPQAQLRQAPPPTATELPAV